MNTCRCTVLAAILALAACGGCNSDDEPDLPAIDAATDVDASQSDGADTSVDIGAAEAILAIPETGRRQIPGLQDEVQIVRTAGDVPHIYASTARDAYVAAGFVMARDRYFEIDVGARLALGEVSGLLGQFALLVDIDNRGGGMTHLADRLVATMDAETRATFEAFAEGINAYVAAVRAGELLAPSELELAAPLVGQDSGADLVREIDVRILAGFLAVVVYISSFTDFDLVTEAIAQSMTDRFTGGVDPLDALRQAGMENELWTGVQPRHDISVAGGWGLNGTLASTMSLQTPIAGPTIPPRVLPPLPPSMRDRILAREHRMPWFSTRTPSDKGSNAWAIAPDGTADGSTLLAGDGHLPLGNPTLFFQMGLDVRTFGDDPLRLMGLYLPGFPYLAVGTNGDVAWSQTYPRADVMDWYQEEIQLDANGAPVASMFDGVWQPLMRFEESYEVAPILSFDGRTETWPRWTTFDGRFLREIEGRTVDDPANETLQPGEVIVVMQNGYVVPADEDGDGVITGISVDFTGFDIGNMFPSLDRMQRAETVEEFHEQMHRFTGYAQNLLVADRSGSIGFWNFSATPCRDYLPRNADGSPVAGADPQRVLDGTIYGAFEVPMQADLVVTGDADPQRCMIDADVFPRVLRSDGWVSTANNDPTGATFDNDIWNDPAYIGGPYVPGYRARAIADGLDAAVAKGATAQDMADLQGYQESLVGRDLAPVLIATIERMQTGAATTPAESRALSLYEARAAEFDEVAERLQNWLDAGALPASGVETFYDTPTDQDRQDAVATTIFNTWLRRWIQEVFADEPVLDVIGRPGRTRGAVMRALRTLVDGRGPDNPMDLAGWNPDTEESVFFDDRDTPAVVEEHDETVLAALTAALDYLASLPLAGANGGFGTNDMNAWLWGLRHRVELNSQLAAFGAGVAAVDVLASQFAIDTKVLPLAEEFDDADPRRTLRWFPRDGDLFGVDAANPDFFEERNFDYADGPVMRMVIELHPDGSVSGRNILPAGQSALTDSPFFADQAQLWLANETLPIQWAPHDVAAAATGREVLTP